MRPMLLSRMFRQSFCACRLMTSIIPMILSSVLLSPLMNWRRWRSFTDIATSTVGCCPRLAARSRLGWRSRIGVGLCLRRRRFWMELRRTLDRRPSVSLVPPPYSGEMPNPPSSGIRLSSPGPLPSFDAWLMSDNNDPASGLNCFSRSPS